MKTISRFSTILTCLFVGIFAGVVQPTYAAPLPILQESVPGSFLVFTKFDIRSGTSTQYRIVNNEDRFARVKINYVCPGIKHGDDRCRALDRTFDFTPHQTRVIDVADQNPPCNQGYAVAFVTDTASEPGELDPDSDGRAVRYDALIGSYSIESGRRVEAVNAVSIQALREINGASEVQDGGGQCLLGSGTPTQFAFGEDYVALPSTLVTDFRATDPEDPAEGSRLTLLTLDVLAGAQNPPALANIDFWSASEEPFSTSIEFICWTEVALEAIDANFLEENLGTSNGSLKITPIGNCPVAGLCPPVPLYDATMLGSIVQYGDGEVGGRLLAHDYLAKTTVYRPR